MRKARPWVAILAVAVIWWLTLAPTQMGGPITLAVVSGTSMQPALEDGDLVVAVRQNDYQIGDTVIYDKLGGIVIHEIYAVVGDAAAPTDANPSPVFKTRGINNQHFDSWRVHASEIRGKLAFVLGGGGRPIIEFTSSPLLAGVTATALAAFVLLPRARPRINPRLRELLRHSATERRRIKQALAIEFTWLLVLTLATFLASALLLVRHMPLWPQLALSLTALLVSVLLLSGFWVYYASGRNLAEPQRSMAVLGPRLHRIDSSLKVDALPTQSADELSRIRDRTGLPVLHQIADRSLDERTGMITATHRFFVMTEKQTYVWSVKVLQLKEHHE